MDFQGFSGIEPQNYRIYDLSVWEQFGKSEGSPGWLVQLMRLQSPTIYFPY